MADVTTEINTAGGPLTPSKGTLDCAANVLLLRGTIVTVDSDGRGDVPTAGQSAAGVASATVDNRTTSPEGGAAAALQVEVEFGVKALDYVGAAPEPGQVVFVVDNHTVSTDSDSGTRGIAGYCSETRRDAQGVSRCYTLMGPAIVGQIVIAATEASQLDTAQADIDALQANAASASRYVDIPIANFILATGAPLALFANGDSAVPGLELNNSKALGVRWNNKATSDRILGSFTIPDDADVAASMVVHVRASKSGATDATSFAVQLYNQALAATADADADYGGASSAMVAAAAAKTIQNVTRTLASVDLPAVGNSVTIMIAPTAGTLATDDVTIHSVRVYYTGKMLA